MNPLRPAALCLALSALAGCSAFDVLDPAVMARRSVQRSLDYQAAVNAFAPADAKSDPMLDDFVAAVRAAQVGDPYDPVDRLARRAAVTVRETTRVGGVQVVTYSWGYGAEATFAADEESGRITAIVRRGF